MNILIISTNRNQFPMPVIPIGACMIAEAAQNAGHKVRLLDLIFEREPLNAIYFQAGLVFHLIADNA